MLVSLCIAGITVTTTGIVTAANGIAGAVVRNALCVLFHEIF